MLDNGLIQFEITHKDAFENTLINGKMLAEDDPKQILNHLDILSFGSGQMLLFKYPMMKRRAEGFKDAIKQEQED